MATTVKTHDFRSGRRGALYPWTEWFDGRIWKLETGKDFTVKEQSFVMAAYQRAHRVGGRVRIDKASEPGFVFVHFTTKSGK